MKGMQHHFKTQKTARYFSLGDPESSKILYVLHGYGQLASYFIEKFNDLSKEYFIIAPEGFHRFYVKGFSGRVGASWMSKEDRLTDIDDYVNFLNGLHKNLSSQHSYQHICVLGFSQGVATMFRWIEHADFIPDKALICSGMIPPDVKLDHQKIAWDKTNWSYISGDNDPFRNEKEVQQLKTHFKIASIELNEYVFEGGHSLNLHCIKQALQQN